MAGQIAPGGQSHDLGAEQACLGAMLASLDACDQVMQVLRSAADFYRPAHQIVYEAIVRLVEGGERPDAVTVLNGLQRAGTAAKCGGAPYLHTLVAACPVALSAGHYARIVREHALRRDVDSAGQRIRQIAAQSDADDIPVLADQALTGALEAPEADSAVPVGDVLPEVWEQAENPRQHHGVDAGLADLDLLTGGFRAGQFVIVGARPGVGKSVMLLQTAGRAAVHDAIPTLVVSLEMSRTECTQRLLAAKASVPLRSLTHGDPGPTDAEWDRLAETAKSLSAAPLYIRDNPAAGLAGIRADLRAMRRAGQVPGLAVIDYLQLMNTGRRAENRQQEVSELSRGLKLLAKDFGLPVIAASQLNRGPEARMDKRPLLADLRESGSLEQDADMVILLHREDAYDRESPRSGEIDLHVAKNRHGPVASVTCGFQAHYVRIVSLAPPGRSSPPAAANHARPDGSRPALAGLGN